MSERTGRNVVERIFIAGTLMLDTPTHFGNGDAAEVADMTLARDALDPSQALLTGASIAGALRAYLREYTGGYGLPDEDLSARLFGKIEGRESYQSWLMVEDARSQPVGVELRDGVAIHPVTRTAEDKKKYDIELLQAGTTFDIGFELLLTEANQDVLPALAVALRGLQNSEIFLGQRKRRGFGQCHVADWQVRRYDLRTTKGLVNWLDDDRLCVISGADIVALLNVKEATARIQDARSAFMVDAKFTVPGSLLIRSGSGTPGEPDMVHLRSQRHGRDASILSGTSLAGAIRARALRIANTIWPENAVQATYLIDETFGRRIQGSDDDPTGSRLIVREAEIVRGAEDQPQPARSLVQSRVKLDRFTGGSYPQALFSQEPIIGSDDTWVQIKLELRQRVTDPEALRQAQVGLLLLVLKDLWTGDLPLGGESSVGRGRLRGQEATLTQKIRGKDADTWKLERVGAGLKATPAALETYVKALWAYRMPEAQGKGAKNG